MTNINRKGLIIGTIPASLKGIASGGIATHIDGLMSALDNIGIATQICYHNPFNVKNHKVIKNTKADWLKSVIKGLVGLPLSGFSFKGWSINNIIKMSYYYGALKTYLKENNPDFIHVHSLHNPASIIINYLGFSDRLIITDHGFRLHPNYESDFQAQKVCHSTFQSAKKVIYISDIYKTLHEESKLGDLKKLVKISNPTEFNTYPIKKKSTTKKDKYIILFNGYKDSLNIKGLRTLLDALSSDIDFAKTVKLIAICNEEAKQFIKNKNWPFEYELKGPIKFSEVLDLYTQSDLLCTPSKFESFGLVYTEAMAVGIPVVGYYGTMDEFKKTLNTYIGESINIEKESADELLGKIKKALNHTFDQNLVRNELIKNFGWDNKLNDFIALYYPNE